ncbi:response regulator transcription factor [Deinococcus cellulosilyticus]|uniref:Response regulatory domain-containing protein n=1 Tax=Deinococcus cellulosilyticus (strain DSM 18568 / NBRC 106333 / KACC 11606 / 5516J-15) TaxID=1223518 RepID=A0A511N8W4_DEIC1|nr:response regulator transcription factor [Deinococcus cellulosilyticus]GEM49270.1 hypothetical protein DC3_49050 [Deinococcus cellulosilyticus NBRC 106333 = KACC 11606]
MKTIMLLGECSTNTLKLQLYFDGQQERTLLYSAPDLNMLQLNPDALVLEVQERFDLRHWLPRLRMRWNVPILLLASRLDREQVVELLDLGADDCIYKPAEPREVRAHLNALWRRYPLLNPSQPT